MKKLLTNLGLSALSGLVFFLFLEFIVFRFIFLAPDIAIPVYVDGLVRYQAGQSGINRIKNEIESSFKINEDGWNSKYEKYETTKDPNIYRVAIIGDSYLAGFQVDYRKSVAEQLESKLGDKTEVYRFGIDGAPMSQYLEILRKEVSKFSPDLVIINIVHNDFNESYSSIDGVFTSAFLKLEIENGKVTKEIPPLAFKAPWYNLIRNHSATWKYLAYRQQVQFGALRDLILGTDKEVDYRANIDTAKLEVYAKKNRLVTDYLFKQIKQHCDENNSELIVMIDADDMGIYEKEKLGKSSNDSVLALNRIATEVAEHQGIHFIDLQNFFENEYANKKKFFGFINDGHWNEYSHDLVANTLSKYIKETIKPKGLVN